MTLAYTTGTVTLVNGSKAVVGTGTGWKTAGIVGGILHVEAVDNPAIPILDDDSAGANTHPITNTALTLALKWMGPSGTYPYAILRDTAYLQQMTTTAQLFADIRADLRSASVGALAALAGTLGAGKVPRGLSGTTMEWMTVTDAMKTVLAAASGSAAYGALGTIPNAQLPSRIRSTGDILSAAGALDAISETGWTNVPTANVATVGGPSGAFGGSVFTQVFDPTTKVQTYRQVVGGVRSWQRQQVGTWGAWAEEGIILDKATTASGAYERWSDGRMDCRVKSAITMSCNTAFGTMYYGSTTINFPSTFADASYVVNGAGRAVGHLLLLVPDYTTAGSGAISAFILSPISFTSLACDIRSTIRGKWQ